MANLSDEIEEFIKRLLDEASGCLEIRRQRLADRFSCAPSQINYVLETRFTTERGYAVESRRGGGGFIRIVRFSLDGHGRILEFLGDHIGDSLPQREAEAIIERLAEDGHLSPREAALMKAAVDREALLVDLPYRDRIRASLLRRMLVAVLSCRSTEDEDS